MTLKKLASGFAVPYEQTLPPAGQHGDVPPTPLFESSLLPPEELSAVQTQINDFPTPAWWQRNKYIKMQKIPWGFESVPRLIILVPTSLPEGWPSCVSPPLLLPEPCAPSLALFLISSLYFCPTLTSWPRYLTADLREKDTLLLL